MTLLAPCDNIRYRVEISQGHFSRYKTHNRAKMQASHGANCLQGCLGHSTSLPGSIVRFNNLKAHSVATNGMNDQLGIILRTSLSEAGASLGDELYHFVPICRTPSVTLGVAYNIRHVNEHEPAYDEAHGPFDLLTMQDTRTDTFVPPTHVNWDPRDCVQPANVARIPRRCLHRLPGNVRLKLVDSSLESLLKEVDGIASVLGDRMSEAALLEGLNDQRRREDIITLSLRRFVDRVQRPVALVISPLGTEDRKNRKASMWEQGTVPRNGGCA